ncbi:MAG: 23S rRNA (guanosine(2251)-2'-O)-methyltransferase RlmB [Campylobacter sp.]|nr:23S rRNA (guanosine(2251)-2'-O)-methyltransferase RlmB [Campylobacter sp.]
MIIYGKQLFLHLLKHHKEKFRKIYLAKELEKPLFKEVSRLNLDIIKVDPKKAQALAKGGNHQGYLAEVDEFEFAEFSALKDLNFLVVLYNLTDVGNIGAILRTAYALGVDGVVVVANSLQIPGIIRSSSGAAYEIPIALQSDGLTLINELKQAGFTTYAADAKGKDIKGQNFTQKKALILGSEGEGIPKKAFIKCDELVAIKMRNGWDSLNVSSAFAIICDMMING